MRDCGKGNCSPPHGGLGVISAPAVSRSWLPPYLKRSLPFHQIVPPVRYLINTQQTPLNEFVVVACLCSFCTITQLTTSASLEGPFVSGNRNTFTPTRPTFLTPNLKVLRFEESVLLHSAFREPTLPTISRKELPLVPRLLAASVLGLPLSRTTHIPFQTQTRLQLYHH